MILPVDKRDRIYVPAHRWGSEFGTDYVLHPAGSLLGATTALDAIVDAGWTTTAITLVRADGADFMASADVGIPAHILTNASGDLLQSPTLFGDYPHANMAWRMMNRDMRLAGVPARLNMEVWAAFSVATANETTSGFGFIEDAGTPVTAGDHLAYIFSDGTNFLLRSGAATSSAGIAVDNTWRRWKITVTQAGVAWYLDDVQQSTGLLALEADEFPVSFAMHTLTTNRVLLGQVHIWYD